MSQQTVIMGESKNPVRAIRDLTLKPRFIQSYGTDEAYFDKSLAYIEYWQDKLFKADEKSFSKAVDDGTLSIEQPYEVDDHSVFPKIVETARNDGLIEELCLNKIINAEINTTTPLKFGQGVSLGELDREGIALNCGGVITSSSWCPWTSGSKTYVAVSVVSSSGAIEDIVSNTELSIFYKTKGDGVLKSCVQIWEYDVETGSTELHRVLNTSKFGACLNLAWAPISHSDIIGVLAGCFKDGKVHLLKIEHGDKYVDVERTSLSYSVTERDSFVAISSFDFLSTDRIIVGTTEGTVSEFVLPNYFTDRQLHNEGDYDLAKPSFTVKVVESPISFITVGNPSKDKWTVQVNSHGTQNVSFDYDSFSYKKIESFDSSIQPIYHNALKVFVCTDGFDTVGHSFVRIPQERPTLMLKTDGVISAIGVSKYLNHPLSLIGNSFGEVYVVNFARRILAQGKTTGKLLVPLRLLKLVYKSKDTVVINGDLVPVPPETNARMTVSPAEVSISTLSWNEVTQGVSVYAAGSHSGLLIISKV